MTPTEFHAGREIATVRVLAAQQTSFLDYGNTLRTIDGDDESFVFEFDKQLAKGGVFMGLDGQPITVMPGHQRTHMDDDTTSAWGGDGPVLSGLYLYQPLTPDAATHGLLPLELWDQVNGTLQCVEQLEWVEDCLRFVGEKANLGFFGDITISGKPVSEFLS